MVTIPAMRIVLHVLTRPTDPLAKDIATRQRKQRQYRIETLDLAVKEPDYRLLLEKLFEADSIEVW